MVVVQSYKARWTPCRSCSTRKDKTRYPDCGDFCSPLNDYLRYLGDHPRKPSKPFQLKKEYLPKQAYFISKDLLTTHEQFLEGAKVLNEIKKLLGYTDDHLAERLGIKTGVIRSIRQGRNQRTMRKEHYQAIMELSKELNL